MNQDPALHPTVARVTARIVERSRSPHADYLRRMEGARTNGPLVGEAQWRSRVAACPSNAASQSGMGRELFALMRAQAGTAEQGACSLFGSEPQPACAA